MRSPTDSLHYQVISPHPLLAPYIACYWILRTTVEHPARHELILPDGYAELILNYGRAYSWYDQQRGANQEIQTVHLIGERDASILVELGGGIDQVGVKFKPLGLFSLVRQPLDEFANQIASPHELSDSSIQELYEQVFATTPDSGKIERLNAFFIQRLLVVDQLEPFIGKALQVILRYQGNIRIEDLKDLLDVHYKTLERKFKTYVGISPKTFARIVRFKNTYKQFHRMAQRDPYFFLDLGYYDQNHFIKDFKYFLHTTPSAYLRKQRSLSDEIVRRGLVERSLNS
ncbi:AraC family transcriptional regulator [Oscillatoria sp. FACHB-1407]|uniref:AraC family transcriptional regulator n=1 Tax=Oscillatoria sp. FACHB-1407 TaxID=2692847 RepID=UPI001689B12C|nr:helix-turn-helix domain-containing protein [Oscillatoria sp. FACHB-1407]MBD2461245.1 AraC family transcriptional regulator [Oscillatoria sp. FACHB-1407]